MHTRHSEMLLYTLKVLTVGHSEVWNLFTHTHRKFDIVPQRQVISDSRLAYTVGQSADLYSRTVG